MSDRIAVMNHGVVEQVDMPEKVYDSPRTTFVAGFIGVSNLMPGVAGPVSGDGTKLVLDSGVTVWAAEDCGVAEGERCYAVVRPEKLRVSLVEEPAPTDRPSVEGMIESSLYLGTATQVVVRLPDEVTMTVLVPNTDEAERQRLPGAGARVRLSWTPDHMHVVKESTNSETGVAT
jgi:spermidine/putrescine transport system ATP-binding protein